MQKILPQDLEMVELYKDILPRRIFDAHAHFYAEGTVPRVQGAGGNFWRDSSRIGDYRQDMAPLFPGVETFAINAIPMPDPILNDRASGFCDKVNFHVFEDAAANIGSCAAAYILKDDTEAEIERKISLPAVKAIKCYWFTSGKTDGNSCSIGDFLPESAWQVSQKRSLPIILHLMHENALLDERNLSYVTGMLKKYPFAPLVLAHCARAFASYTGVFSIPSLAAYENVWFDLAAVCEPAAMLSCIKTVGAKRVMWGTDYPICFFRGKSVSLGKSFHWLTESAYPQSVAPALLVTESLLAFKQAAILSDFDVTMLEDVFYKNAQRLFLK